MVPRLFHVALRWRLVYCRRLLLQPAPVEFCRLGMLVSNGVLCPLYHSVPICSSDAHVRPEKSNMIRSCWYFLSKPGISSWANVSSWVSQLRLALNPCLRSVRISCSSRCLRLLLVTICSWIFVLLPFLKMAVTLGVLRWYAIETYRKQIKLWKKMGRTIPLKWFGASQRTSRFEMVLGRNDPEPSRLLLV